MQTNPAVDAWFEACDHPLKEAMLRVREIILEADPRVCEAIKWNTPTFSYRGNIVGFRHRERREVCLVFHRGTLIPGEYPTFRGTGPERRTLHLSNLVVVEHYKGRLQQAIRGWCEAREQLGAQQFASELVAT